MPESSGRENNKEKDPTGIDSEATSKQTVSDLEENEEDVASGASDLDRGPSPDGDLDESRDKSNDAGPM